MTSKSKTKTTTFGGGVNVSFDVRRGVVFVFLRGASPIKRDLNLSQLSLSFLDT